jgi:hypothetical protein
VGVSGATIFALLRTVATHELVDFYERELDTDAPAVLRLFA